MKKKLNGFTLVELIVVIAIIAVLAAMLVPSMLGYVKKSKVTSANETAREIFNALTINYTESVTYATDDNLKKNSGDKSLSDSNVTGDEGSCVELKKWLAAAYTPQQVKSMNLQDMTGYIDIVYENDYPVAVAWSKDKEPTALVGVYPSQGTGTAGEINWINWDKKFQKDSE